MCTKCSKPRSQLVPVNPRQGCDVTATKCFRQWLKAAVYSIFRHNRWCSCMLVCAEKVCKVICLLATVCMKQCHLAVGDSRRQRKEMCMKHSSPRLRSRSRCWVFADPWNLCKASGHLKSTSRPKRWDLGHIPDGNGLVDLKGGPCRTSGAGCRLYNGQKNDPAWLHIITSSITSSLWNNVLLSNACTW